MHLDDDDVLAPGALPAIRGAIAERPGAAFLFRAALPDGKRIGERPLLKEGNVGTALFVHPASIPLGTFAPRYGGDFDFIAETLARNPDLPLVWRPETTHLLRPDSAPINPEFVDVAQQEGPRGREDCQSGWQEFFGRRFRDVSILDVGAGLGQSRKRLQAGGNRVTLQDPGPGLPVDHQGPLTQFADRSFDVVTAFDVLEHVADGPAFLAELSRIARTAIVVTTPNVWVSRCGNRFHAREYSPPALLDLLAMTPGIHAVDAFASQHPSGRRPCQFPASKFLAVEWPVLAAVGWKTKPR